jgi:hypothetical protein
MRKVVDFHHTKACQGPGSNALARQQVTPHRGKGGPTSRLGHGGPMKKIVSLSVCLVITVMVVGCRSRSPRVLTVPLAGVSDDIVKLDRRVSADGVAVNMDYDHPHDFSQDTLKKEIDLLVVQEFNWDKFGMGSKWLARPAFTKTAAERLVPALVIAFNEAYRSDKILFNVPGRTGQSTRGEVYLQDDKLVWIFKEIDGRTFLGKDPLALDPEDWTIEEKAGLQVKNNKDAKVVKVVRDLSVAPGVTGAVVE